MTDIFVSYAREDQAWVEGFVKVLESRGWTVWWDCYLPGGEPFDTGIKKVLDTTKCVIVVWSKHSVESDYVKEEAAEAKKRKVALPVRIDEVDLPFGFSRLHAHSLVGWREDNAHAGFSRLVKDIERLLGASPSVAIDHRRPWWAQIHPLWLLILLTVVTAVIVTGCLMMWSIPARVQVELTTERIEFVVDAAKSQGKAILDMVDVRSVGVEKFSAISFEPETLEVADPSQYQVEKDEFPPSAWKPLSVTNSKVTLAAKDATRHPRVTVEGLTDGGQPTHLDPITLAQGARVTLETRGGKNEGLTIKMAGQDNFNLSLHGPFKMIADHTEILGLADPPFQKNDELTYKVRLPGRASWIEIAASSDGPVLSPTFASGQSAIPVFRGVPVASLEFTRQDPSGDQVSALTGKGTITFPDYPHLGSVLISEHDAIGLERLDRFTIEQVTLTPGANGMSLVGDGIVGQIRTKTGQIPIKYRLTAFDEPFFLFSGVCFGVFSFSELSRSLPRPQDAPSWGHTVFRDDRREFPFASRGSTASPLGIVRKSVNMLLCPVSNRIDCVTKLEPVDWFEIKEFIAKGHGKRIELIEDIDVGRRQLQAIS